MVQCYRWPRLAKRSPCKILPVNIGVRAAHGSMAHILVTWKHSLEDTHNGVHITVYFELRH